MPLLATNVSNVAGFDRNSLQINNTNVAAILKYRTIETNGLVNFTPLRSTIRFWYKPFCSADYCATYNCAGVGNGSGPLRGQFLIMVTRRQRSFERGLLF